VTWKFRSDNKWPTTLNETQLHFKNAIMENDYYDYEYDSVYEYDPLYDDYDPPDEDYDYDDDDLLSIAKNLAEKFDDTRAIFVDMLAIFESLLPLPQQHFAPISACSQQMETRLGHLELKDHHAKLNVTTTKNQSRIKIKKSYAAVCKVKVSERRSKLKARNGQKDHTSERMKAKNLLHKKRCALFHKVKNQLTNQITLTFEKLLDYIPRKEKIIFVWDPGGIVLSTDWNRKSFN
jgi:hypothetical protein